jgi:hypothetical protein
VQGVVKFLYGLIPFNIAVFSAELVWNSHTNYGPTFLSRNDVELPSLIFGKIPRIFMGSRLRPAQKAENLTAICEPIAKKM